MRQLRRLPLKTFCCKAITIIPELARVFFQTLSHAGLRIDACGKTLVCDPWLVGSAYWRSWWNYPPVPAGLLDTLKPDFIYLTHLHWDHFHGPTLKRFDPATPVIVPYDRYGRMVRDLATIGMTNIHELTHGAHFDMAPDFRLTSYHISPFVTDSAAVIEAEGVTLLNANDAKLAGAPLNHLLSRHGPIDFAFRSHSSANPRANFHYIDAPDEHLDDSDHYIRAFLLFMARVKPRYAIPFASNICFLHDDTWAMNDQVQTPVRVADAFTAFAAGQHLATKVQTMKPGDLWDRAQGFKIDATDWYSDRPARLAVYRARVAPTMERQAAREARIAVKPHTVEVFMKKLIAAAPVILMRGLKNKHLLILSTAGAQQTGFSIDLNSGTTTQVPPASFADFAMRIEIPALILRQSIAMNMFGHAAISKRVHFYATRATMPALRRFQSLLEWHEAELLPVSANITARTIKALLPRWREGLLYSHVIAERARGTDFPEIERRLLA